MKMRLLILALAIEGAVVALCAWAQSASSSATVQIITRLPDGGYSK